MGDLLNFFAMMPEIQMVVLYGSAAGQGLSPYSDVDIAVSGPDRISPVRLLDMNVRLQILLKRDIDLVDIRTINGLLHYKIFTKGILIKGSAGMMADERIKALDFHADFLPQLNRLRKKRIEKVIHGA